MSGFVPPLPITTLGRSGLFVSRMGLGSWVTFNTAVDEDLGYQLMKRAYELGINFFDNAEIYENGAAERLMGACVQRGIAEGVWTRADLVLTTKLFFGASRDAKLNARGLSRKHIVEGMAASLERLNLAYVDVVFCHRPDPYTPMEETVRAMNWLIEQGKAFYWGTSEWSAAELQEAMTIADRLGLVRPVSEQSQYSMLHRHRVEVEHVPLYEHYGVGNTIWSPLGSGVLTGKYANGIPADSRLALEQYAWLKDRVLGPNLENVKTTEALRPIAASLDCSLSQLALAWCLCNRHVSVVLLGATSIEQLEENVAAKDVVPKLTPEILAEIEKVLLNKPVASDTHQMVQQIRKPWL